MSDLSAYSVSTIHDIVTDPTNVYVLYTSVAGNTNILTTSSNLQGTWATVSVPFQATSIFSTHTYLWAQDSSNNKQMCPKPCVMANWIPSSETTIKITSSTDSHLYGVDPTGAAMQTDETLRSGWSPIQGFGKVQSVIGSQNAVYGIDQSNNAVTSDGTQLPTSGYTPLTLTTGNNQLWMTSATPGTAGNVFNRIETADYSGLTNVVAPLDQKRDEVVKDIQKEFNQQTDVMTVNKQVTDVIKFFKDIFHIDGNTAKKSKSQAGHIQEQIRSTQEKLDQMNMLEPILQVVIGILVLVAGLYIAFGGVLGWFTHVLAVGIVAGGVFFLVKFK
jgi:hypothetical protein